MISSIPNRSVMCQKRFLYPLGYDISTNTTSHLSYSNSSGVASLVLKSAILLAGKQPELPDRNVKLMIHYIFLMSVTFTQELNVSLNPHHLRRCFLISFLLRVRTIWPIWNSVLGDTVTSTSS